jgi:uncharacterized protein (DUF952 family)
VAQYHDSTASRDAGITYHLVPEPVWERSRRAATYMPEAYGQDGFIHCTNGTDQLITVANMFYLNDPRPFRVLVLDVASIESEVRYDDPDRVFPHVYGPLNTSAVRGELAVSRDDDGTFLSIGTG